MSSLRIFVTRQIFPEALELLTPHAQLEVWPEEYPPPPQVLKEKAAGAQGLLTNVMDRLDQRLLDAAPDSCLRPLQPRLQCVWDWAREEVTATNAWEQKPKSKRR